MALNSHFAPLSISLSRAGRVQRPTRKFILSGTGILPVKEKGAISKFKHKAQVNQYLDFIILDKFYI